MGAAHWQYAGEIGKPAGDEKTCEKRLYLDLEAEGGEVTQVSTVKY